MKRTALKRRAGLSRGFRLRSRPKPRPAREEPARAAWKAPVAGYCECGCGRFALRLDRHHIVYEQHVRAEHGRVFDLANSMLLLRSHHAEHHSGQRRVHVEALPDSALAFAVDLFGSDERAAAYVQRYYRADDGQGRGRAV